MDDRTTRTSPGADDGTTVHVESSGEIETLCRRAVVPAGDPIHLVFRAYEDATAPFSLKIRAPSGKVILERVVRELPTPGPQSAPPVDLHPLTSGDYRLEIKQLYGSERGAAVLRVRVAA